MREYCLRILYYVNEDQLKSMNLNTNLLNNYLNDQRSYVAHIIGIQYQTYDTRSDDNDTKTYMDDDIIHNDTDIDIRNTILIIFQHFFQNFQLENNDDIDIQNICAKRISILLTEFLFNRDDILCINVSILLKLIIDKNLKKEFIEYEINNICIVLQTHPNELVRQYIQLELITQEILKKEILNEYDCTNLELNLNTYLNAVTFCNKILPINVFEIIYKILKRNLYKPNLFLLLLEYVQNSQKLPNQLIKSLGNQLANDKNQILIQILYYV
ncbi:unnamed protein product, partial [Didymodactylos carnosus]